MKASSDLEEWTDHAVQLLNQRFALKRETRILKIDNNQISDTESLRIM